jgi:hypothetical protein
MKRLFFFVVAKASMSSGGSGQHALGLTRPAATDGPARVGVGKGPHPLSQRKADLFFHLHGDHCRSLASNSKALTQQSNGCTSFSFLPLPAMAAQAVRALYTDRMSIILAVDWC